MVSATCRANIEPGRTCSETLLLTFSQTWNIHWNLVVFTKICFSTWSDCDLDATCVLVRMDPTFNETNCAKKAP